MERRILDADESTDPILRRSRYCPAIPRSLRRVKAIRNWAAERILQLHRQLLQRV